MDNEALRFQKAAQAWIFEMNLINNPQAIDIIRLNVLMSSKYIKTCELLVSLEHTAILVWVDIPGKFTNWRLGRKGLKNICEDAERLLKKLMPSFAIRVTNQKEIFELSLKRIQELAEGTFDEKSNPNTDNSSMGDNL